jgi:hypothetical protein
VAVVGPGEAWAIGAGCLHYQNGTWTDVILPSWPTAISALSDGEAWAVGVGGMLMHYDPRVPGQLFYDVPPDSPFYAGVQDLAARGAISGYADSTFRPANNVTRGQLSKIVSLAFGQASVTPADGGYTFADVVPDSTFFTYVETSAANGVIGGYACGGTNPATGTAEPCDGAHRPYYRPGNTLTRAQLSKIVVGTAGWPLLTPATATFSDVPVGSTFFEQVETAACHGVLGGYADGTFRPGNPASRGQTAKIVDNAILGTTPCSAARPWH